MSVKEGEERPRREMKGTRRVRLSKPTKSTKSSVTSPRQMTVNIACYRKGNDNATILFLPESRIQNPHPVPKSLYIVGHIKQHLKFPMFWERLPCGLDTTRPT